MKNLDILREKISFLNKLQRPFLEKAVGHLYPDELEELELYISDCLSGGWDIDYLAQSYDLIVKDTVREQMYFKKHKRYRYSTYEQVKSAVYLNDEYMSKYMQGLALTSFLWPNHAKMRKYFLETIPKETKGKYLEVGPGHGFYFLQAMKRTKYDWFYGVDISPTSVEMTEKILASAGFGHRSNYKIIQGNFLDFAFDQIFDAAVMGEVLEHVEEPRAFLEKLKDVTAADAYIFLTTCINTPAFDHIFLFESVSHVESSIVAAGLTVKDKCVLPYSGCSLEDSEKNKLPVNIALILGK
jgi:2-polyprenyl-3-methyl-5-hydroxy-6-metoxy-1,4-benzoquinol methylase